ncbi:MAG: RNA polymerase sigma-70 factor [Ignavibacteriales bacterium]|nr:RNA polymerase sigma-70 factor [Ignavibacteriales bacterium]
MDKENNEEDFQLLDHIKKDDPLALKALFIKYYNPLCYFSFQIVKSTELSEETVSDVFAELWIKRNRINVQTSFKSYLYTAVKNRSINYYKQEKRLAEALKPNQLHLITSQTETDHIVNQQDLEKQIEELLKQLPEKRGLIFRMNRIDGLSYQEIADILSISIHTVQNQMIKAVKFMAEQFPRIKKLFSILF